jgi:putative SOS response-associated peptidase YedK
MNGVRSSAPNNHFIALKGREPFAFAGIWEHWAQGDQSIDPGGGARADARRV